MYIERRRFLSFSDPSCLNKFLFSDNIIATTSTNGAVVLWDVQKAALGIVFTAFSA